MILVAYASKHGATREIAERVGEKLSAAGHEAQVWPVESTGDLAGYEAFVIGSAAYSMHWLKEAAEFVRRNRALLADRPLGLFSSAPLGTEATDTKGRDLQEAAEPKEIAEFRQAVGPRDHRVFFGALDPGKLGFAERSIRKLPAARAMLPEGDFRDWASGIAREIAQTPTN